MSTWRKRFSRKSQRLNENDETFLNNTAKYRKKVQAAISQITRTKKAVQRTFDSPGSEIHVARLINDIGQLSDCRPLQEVTSLIDSLAMRHQLSSRIFNEYAMNSLQHALKKLNDNLSNDFDKTKSVFDEAVTNHCSDHTKNQLLSKVQTEWSKHQQLAVKELKQGLSSYCDIGLYNLKIQIAILEKLQSFIDQLPRDDADIHNALPNFSGNFIQARREIDTLLRVMLDAAPNDPVSLPAAKRPKFLENNLTLSNSLYSPEISEAAASSNFQAIGPRSAPSTPQYPPIPSYTTDANRRTPQYEATIRTPLTPQNGRFLTTPEDDPLPSYSDLFVVPSNCK